MATAENLTAEKATKIDEKGVNEMPMPQAEEIEAICKVASARTVSPVPANKTRVAVLMSGGVDSSATALLMQKAGYDVIGVTGWLIKSGSRCCDTGMIDAARVCEQLGIEHHAVDLREMFKTEIMDQFHESYARARTPLPCSLCNTLVKWGALLRYGKKILNASYIATGHYARVVETEHGTRLAKARDEHKDQSYVLWGLTMEQVKSTLLPLGEFTKDEIRAIATEGGLVTANRPDSQDLCFIPRGTTTQQYLSNFLKVEPGPIIHTVTGQILGEHQGTFNYTIGQRKGLGIASSEPLYVTSVDPDLRVVYVGPKEALLRRELTASFTNWILESPPVEPFKALAKIRYNSKAEPAEITPLPDNKVQVVFDEPQPAITPGQVLGIYDLGDQYILGGGWID
ncbi:MAG: tRNA 2-thiouridine(34) synthase MnmA [Cyanobacteria bacterium SZAS LIN-3]|nr:tRNA 2-thiouridine(34) synthase MnmA [Cyanobacteria bacterium SZAS LIN-3]